MSQPFACAARRACSTSSRISSIIASPREWMDELTSSVAKVASSAKRVACGPVARCA
jgi:hypothetical protein